MIYLCLNCRMGHYGPTSEPSPRSPKIVGECITDTSNAPPVRDFTLPQIPNSFSSAATFFGLFNFFTTSTLPDFIEIGGLPQHWKAGASIFSLLVLHLPWPPADPGVSP